MSKRINVKNILKVADRMEAAARPEARPAIGYNQAALVIATGLPDRSGHGCTTVGCILGWADSIFDRRMSVAERLGIGPQQQDELFNAYPKTAIDPDIQQAVRTLRHLANTGEVDWGVGA